MLAEDMNALEQYISEMENRSAIENSNNLQEDVWTQLQQKDNDLMLAAELGKALLEKNEELKKQQEATVDEYTKKLEVSHRYLVSLQITSSHRSNSVTRFLIYVLIFRQFSEALFSFNLIAFLICRNK